MFPVIAFLPHPWELGLEVVETNRWGGADPHPGAGGGGHSVVALPFGILRWASSMPVISSPLYRLYIQFLAGQLPLITVLFMASRHAATVLSTEVELDKLLRALIHHPVPGGLGRGGRGGCRRSQGAI